MNGTHTNPFIFSLRPVIRDKKITSRKPESSQFVPLGDLECGPGGFHGQIPKNPLIAKSLFE